MEFPIEVSFRDFEPSDAVRRRIYAEIDKLNKMFDRIHSIYVAVLSPHRHKRQGNIFHVHIKLHIPGKDLVVTHEPEKNKAHEDIYVTIRDAFRSMARELEHTGVKRRLENRVKTSIERKDQLHGVIDHLNTLEKYGFIKGDNGVEYYFHPNSVINHDFFHLQVGDHVRFSEEMGEKGPQASSLAVL